MKNSFVLYTDYKEILSELSQEQKGNLLDAIFDYALGESVNLDPATKMAFKFISAQMDRDNERWEKTRKARQEAGSKGGLAKASNAKQKLANASKAKQTLANQAVNVNVNVNDNVINTKRNIKEKVVELPTEKIPHGELGNVLLYDDEYQKLIQVYGEERTEKAIAYLDTYIASKGIESFSHYSDIKRWVIDVIDGKEPKTKARNFINIDSSYEHEDFKELEYKILEN